MSKCENSGCTDRSVFAEEASKQHVIHEHKCHEVLRILLSLEPGQWPRTQHEIDILLPMEYDFLNGIFRFPCLHICEESNIACEIACYSPLSLMIHQKMHLKMSPSKRFPNHGDFPREPRQCPLQCLVLDPAAGGVCLHVCKDELALEIHRSEHINGIPFTDLRNPLVPIPPMSTLACSHQECKQALFLNERLLGIHNDFWEGVYHFRCSHPCTHSGKECGLAFSSPLELISHEVKHEGWSLTDPKNVKCNHCDATFWHKTLRSKHCQQNHPQQVTAFRAQRRKDDATARQKYAANENLRIAKSLRSSLTNIFATSSKATESTTKQLLGVSIEEARAHLNNNENGLKLGDVDVHIDHIRPMSSFDLKRCKIEIMQCFSIFNLQLMRGCEARAKNKKTFSDADWFKYVPIQAKIATLRPGWLQDGKCTCGTCE